MKKLFALITFAAMLNLSYLPLAVAQDGENAEETTEMAAEETDSEAPAEAAGETAADEAALEEAEEASPGFHQTLKTKFIEGGAGFMGVVLLVLILGLALSIERIIYLSLATGDSGKLLGEIGFFQEE